MREIGTRKWGRMTDRKQSSRADKKIYGGNIEKAKLYFSKFKAIDYIEGDIHYLKKIEKYIFSS